MGRGKGSRRFGKSEHIGAGQRGPEVWRGRGKIRREQEGISHVSELSKGNPGGREGSHWIPHFGNQYKATSRATER